MTLPVLFALLAATSPGGQAAATPGYLLARDLLARCTSAQGSDYCYGYVASAYDTSLAHESWLQIKELCVPAGTTQGELVDSVVTYLKANPQQLDSQAASIVVVALQRRYLCTVPAVTRE